ncbi:hypothetical protein [Cytobacillus sp. FSL R7-0680]|uniref:hypothetical protein n=1 Tax=Cytobacillus sp. FSL R7-0680 TaxID=2921689 RepID=UPI0030FD13AA
MYLKQKIERIDPAVFTAETTFTDKAGNVIVRSRTYERCNSIYAAYKSLVFALYDVEDCEVKFTTNHRQLNRELFEEKNKNTTLANMLDDVLAKNNIKLIQ